MPDAVSRLDGLYFFRTEAAALRAIDRWECSEKASFVCKIRFWPTATTVADSEWITEDLLGDDDNWMPRYWRGEQKEAMLRFRRCSPEVSALSRTPTLGVRHTNGYTKSSHLRPSYFRCRPRRSAAAVIPPDRLSRGLLQPTTGSLAVTTSMSRTSRLDQGSTWRR